MNTKLVTFPLTLALVMGCSTALAERAAAVPGSPVGTHELAQAASCLVTGPSHTIAEHARVQPGIEVTSSTNKLVLRVSTKRNEAVEMEMDPASGTTTPGAAREPRACGAPLENAKMSPADSSFAIGTSDGKLALSTCNSDRVETLWDVSSAAVRDLQIVSIGQHEGFAIAYRQDDAVWMGRLDSEKKPVGPLTKIAEKAHLRWPTLAESNGSVLLAWAEREGGSDKWSLGAASFSKTGAPKTSHLELPGGGIGGDALQPALAGLEGGRFLLAWTEGTTWAHQVRAVTVDAAGAPIGAAVGVSDRDGGWAQVAITPEGRGAVVFMTPVEGGFAAVATPVTCAAPEESIALAALHR
jgi:hypothetical protein